MSITRRSILKCTSALPLAVITVRHAGGNPLGLPLGIQPYTVRDDLKRDFVDTLKKLHEMGYREIELSGGPAYDGFYGHNPADLKPILDDADLRAPSCHYGPPKDDAEWASNIEGAHRLGLQYMLCASPGGNIRSLDAWKRTAELFNRLGRQSKDADMQFGYHNHNFEFRTYDGVIAYDQLLRDTDKDLVSMELDCFWMIFAGHNPVEYFKTHPGRFHQLHIKDLKPGYQPTTGDFKGNPFAEVGKGTIDWKRIFHDAPIGGVKHYYVEQDMWDRPSLECARISAEYLKNLKV